MEKLINLFVIFVFLLIGCSDKQGGEGIVVPQIDTDLAQRIDLDDWVDEITCVPLESTPDAMFSDCWKIIEYKTHFYLYSLSDFSVFVFAKDGQLVRRISGKGKGKIETPTDIYINAEVEQLWILDKYFFLNKYTLNGDFVERVPLSASAVKIATAGNDSYWFFGGEFDKQSPFYIRLVDGGSLKPKNDFIAKNKLSNITPKIPSSLFAVSGKETFALLPLRDTIYRCNGGVKAYVEPFCQLDFHGKLFTEKDYPSQGLSFEEGANLIKEKKFILNINSFYASSGYLFFKLNGAADDFYALSTEKKELYKFDSLFDELLPSASTPASAIQGTTEDELLFIFSAEELVAHYSSPNKKSRYEPINRLLRTLAPTDNWVIVCVKLKHTKDK